MNREVQKRDLFLLKSRVNSHLGRINEAMLNWKTVCELSNNRTDSLLLRSRKHIHLMADDVNKLQFLDLFLTPDDDIHSELHQHVLDTLLETDNSNRRKAIEHMSYLIKHYEAEPDACELLLYFEALLYKNILPFSTDNVDKVTSKLETLREVCKDVYIRKIQIDLASIANEIQFGRYEEALVRIEHLESISSGTDMSHDDSILLKMLKANIHSAKGEYEDAKDLIMTVFKYSEQQVMYHGQDLLVSVKDFREVIASLSRTTSIYSQNYFVKWNVFLDHLSIYLSDSNTRYSTQSVEREFRKVFALAADRKLGPDVLHQCYNALLDFPVQFLDTKDKRCRCFGSKFNIYINKIKFHLSVLARNMLHSISRGFVDEEREYARLAKKYKANYFEIYIAEGTALVQRGKIERAKLSFDKAVESVYPFQIVAANVYAERANYHTHIYDFKKAEADLEIARKATPCVALIYTEWGRLYFKMGRIEEGEAHFKTSIEMNTKDARTYTTRASCYLDYHFFEKAFDDLKVVKELNPHEFIYLYHVSILFIRCRDYDNAAAYAAKAREVNGEDCRSYILDSYIAYKLGYFKESLESLKLAERKNPSDSRIFVMYGLLHKIKDLNIKDCYDRRRKAISKTYQMVNKPNEFLISAVISSQKLSTRQLADILYIAKRVYLKSPHRFLVGRIIADYLMRKEKYRLAFVYYTRVIQIYPYDSSLSDDQKEAYRQYKAQALRTLNQHVSRINQPFEADLQNFEIKSKEINNRLAAMNARVELDADRVHKAKDVLNNLKEKCIKTFV